MGDVRNPGSTVSLAPVIKRAGLSDHDKPAPAPQRTAPSVVNRRHAPRTCRVALEAWGMKSEGLGGDPANPQVQLPGVNLDHDCVGAVREPPPVGRIRTGMDFADGVLLLAS